MVIGQITEAKTYSFVNARIKARKGQLLSAADYERLLSSALQEGLTYLSTTPRYIESLNDLDPNSKDFPQQLERILYENVFSEIIDLVKDISDTARELIEFYLKKSYIGTLKFILRQLHSKELQSLSLDELFAMNLEEKTELVLLSEVESIEKTLEKLQSPWVIKGLKPAITEYNKQKNILLLENALDHSFYNQLWDKIIPSQKKKDRNISQKIIGMEIDLHNLNIVLRGKLLDIPPEDIKLQIIPIKYRLQSVLRNAIEASSFSDSIDILQSTAYSDLIRSIHKDYKEKNESLDNLKQLQQEWFIQSLFTLLAGYPFHIGTILSYLIFRLQETDNIRKIFEAKWKEIDLKFARELLIYFK
ncbi:MAG: V-type ATPase subunit [Candidatus Hodarchaeales archaeon]|jgi:vacuolar-type H+-ATPase subunit C/Vma6